MKAIVKFLLYLWQLPQNLIGLLLVAILKPESSSDFVRARLYYASRMSGGISLGRYIIVRPTIVDDSGRSVWHEYGHCRQSMYLGPLYLLVIGLPSLIWAAVWQPGNGTSYYDFYTEAWADKLGGVDRC